MEKGKKILMNSFWSSSGWKGGKVSEEDFDIAREAGFMFDYPQYETHAETLSKLDTLLAEIDPVKVSNAFLYSLSTRRLDYRSALGSYYYAVAIPKHGLSQDKTHCYLCGWYAWKREPNEYEKRLGLNVFNFERHKWGGVRHTSLDYAVFDLQQFLKLPEVKPAGEDIDILRKILSCAESLKEHEKVGALRTAVLKEKILKTNRNELGSLLDELGICGILAGDEYPSYEDRFVDEYNRAPEEYKNDFAYPVNRWRAGDGVNRERLKEIFNI
ncbi:MAG: hypothetical protein IJ072_06280 [Oscillospiraceae bacterium]|nr:hypothetical protein [Oscillospiraceae bacterium]